ncbi:hypothetical protein SADUNF_Sadunf02G0158500 [Salix dunnii]|uniref:Prolamin-like domain-containing protein n=1 Tax=Salix dunnii TaxID=1413687 RepID=A0A835TKF6_9ROSI|nr:hypothetical protein SADUNF_Sadunf02G0158500 [Salix dunnii]
MQAKERTPCKPLDSRLKTLLLRFFLTPTELSIPINDSLDCYKATARPLASISNLSARLKLDEESSNCWDSLFQLQACTGEIVLFFLNGETRLGHSCCQALSTVGEHCWPNMIDTLGFTTEESQILEGYCDKAADSTTPSPSAPSVVPAKVVPKKNWVP